MTEIKEGKIARFKEMFVLMSWLTLKRYGKKTYFFRKKVSAKWNALAPLAPSLFWC